VERLRSNFLERDGSALRLEEWSRSSFLFGWWNVNVLITWTV
jgi:hypothetical protein